MPDRSNTPGTELSTALRTCRSAFLAIAVFSGAINLLMLTGAVFMLAIYDRVLPSHSLATLAGLAILALILFAFQGALDLIRGRILVRIGIALDQAVSGRVFDALVRLPLRSNMKSDTQLPLRDLDHVRSFLSGGGPVAFCDLPWIPLYLVLIFSFHPLLGSTALLGALVLAGLTVMAEWYTRRPSREASRAGSARAELAEASRRNSEVVTAMGMGARLGARWQAANQKYQEQNRRSSDVAGGFGAVTRSLRFVLQSTMLGLGAWLVISDQATAGIIIAGSILVGRALAPVDAAIANAKSFNAARQGWARLTELLALLPAVTSRTALPMPQSNMRVEALSVLAPGTQVLLIHDVNFVATAGQAVGIIGPSGSGKSCLARTLAGAWQPARGHVRLDDAPLDQFPATALGHLVGYLPQDVELFSGTVAENISRFDPQARSDAITAAAIEAGAHTMILGLPDGYDTQIGEHGAVLSAGQRQRVALARALFGAPFLTVLDEPNSNLDAEGDAALVAAIKAIKGRRGIVVLVTHRSNALAEMDLIVAMQKGRAQLATPGKAIRSTEMQPAVAEPAVANQFVAEPVSGQTVAVTRSVAPPVTDETGQPTRLRIMTRPLAKFKNS